MDSMGNTLQKSFMECEKFVVQTPDGVESVYSEAFLVGDFAVFVNPGLNCVLFPLGKHSLAKDGCFSVTLSCPSCTVLGLVEEELAPHGGQYGRYLDLHSLNKSQINHLLDLLDVRGSDLHTPLFFLRCDGNGLFSLNLLENGELLASWHGVEDDLPFSFEQITKMS